MHKEVPRKLELPKDVESYRYVVLISDAGLFTPIGVAKAE